MYWLKYVLVCLVTIIACAFMIPYEGYWRAFGCLLIIPIAPVFMSSFAGRFMEMGLYKPAEFLLWVSMALNRFLDYLPINPWWYGKRYPLDQLAELYLRSERFAECQEYAEEAIRFRKDEKSASGPKIMLTLTEALRAQSKLIASEDYAKKSLDMAEAAARGYVPDKWMLPMQARAHKELSLTKLEEGLYQEAEHWARVALKVISEAPTNINLSVYELVREYCSIVSSFGYALMARERAEDALSQFKRVENIACKAFVRANEIQLKAIVDSAAASIKLERFEDAEKSLEQAQRMIDESKYSVSTQADRDYTLGVLVLHRKTFAEAEHLFQSALAKREKIYGLLHPRVAEVCLSLARTKFESGQSTDAQAWLKRAIDIYAAQEPIDSAKVTSAISLSYVWSGKKPESEPQENEDRVSGDKDPGNGQ